MKFYCVKDSSGNPIAYFYFDPFSRPSEKRGGAWMDEVVSRSRVFSRDGTSPRLPVAHVVCNQMPPVGNKPSLMTFGEVSILALSISLGFWVLKMTSCNWSGDQQLVVQQKSCPEPN